MVPPMVTTAAQLDNMLLLVVGGGDVQALARQLMQTLGSLAAGMVPGAAGATAVSLAPLAAARRWRWMAKLVLTGLGARRWTGMLILTGGCRGCPMC